MQLDPAPWPGEPFPHELGMMIERVVEKDMDEHEHRIERLDRFQETNRRGGVDGQGLDHLGLAGLQIDRAVNVDALTPARLFNRELLLARRSGFHKRARIPSRSRRRSGASNAAVPRLPTPSNRPLASHSDSLRSRPHRSW